MISMYHIGYVFVLFEYKHSKLICSIYTPCKRIDKWKLLQTKSISRPGFNTLDNRTKTSVQLQLLKSMHQNPNYALKHYLQYNKQLNL